MNKEVLINGKKVMCEILPECKEDSSPENLHKEYQEGESPHAEYQEDESPHAEYQEDESPENSHDEYNAVPDQMDWTRQEWQAMTCFIPQQQSPYFAAQIGFAPGFSQQFVAQNSVMPNPAQYGNQSQQLQSDEVSRKPRRSISGDELCICTDGYWRLVTTFDDDTPPVIGNIVFTNVCGNCCVSILRCSKISGVKKHFAIAFPSEMVIGKIEGNLKKNIKDAFLQSGIQLSRKIKVSRLENALECFFAPKIEKCINEILILERAEWIFENNICVFKYFPDHFMNVQTFSEFPIKRKHFAIDRYYPNWENDYLEIFKSIENEEDRSLFMILPVAGVLSSMLHIKGFRPLIVNVICGHKGDVSWLSDIACVFNRAQNNFIPADMSDKALSRKVYESHNDVLLLDARCSGCETPYNVLKMKKNVTKIVEYFGRGVQNEFPDLDVMTNAAVMIVNDAQVINDSVYNLFMEPTTIVRSMKMTNAISSFIVDFVKWVELNFSTVDSILSAPVTRQKRIINIMVQTIDKFWTSKGVDVRSVLSLNNSTTIIRENTDSVVNAFIRSVRSCARFYRGTTDRSQILDGCVYYDETNLVFPNTVFNEILEKRGLQRRKKEIPKVIRKGS